MIEVEQKAFLDNSKHSNAVQARLHSLYVNAKPTRTLTQTNHYFFAADSKIAEQAMTKLSFLPASAHQQLTKLISKSSELSIRTRCNNDEPGQTIFVVKGARAAGGDAAHDIDRLEFEAAIPLQQEAADSQLVTAGFGIQAKWYAERAHIKLDANTTAELIFSPGYGHMLEVEIVAESSDGVARAKQQIATILKQLKLSPVDPALIKKMFAYYNAHWEEYYMTRNTFAKKGVQFS